MIEKNFIPAYPHETYDKYTGKINGFYGGMSLRDYFAAKALTALIPMNGQADLAEVAYKLADAMLAEREKQTE